MKTLFTDIARTVVDVVDAADGAVYEVNVTYQPKRLTFKEAFNHAEEVKSRDPEVTVRLLNTATRLFSEISAPAPTVTRRAVEEAAQEFLARPTPANYVSLGKIAAAYTAQEEDKVDDSVSAEPCW